MGESADSLIPIVLEFGAAVSALTDVATARGFSSNLAAEVSKLVEQLELPGHPVIELRKGKSQQALRILIHGRLQPYSPALMFRVWSGVAPAELQALPETSGKDTNDRFPDGWFQALVAAFTPDIPPRSSDLVFSFLTQLVLEALRERPASLLNPANTTAYSGGPGSVLPDMEKPAIQQALFPVLRGLLDMWMPLRERAWLLQCVNRALGVGRSVDDIVEIALAYVCRPSIEIHIHPEFLKVILADGHDEEPLPVPPQSMEERSREFLRGLNNQLFRESGVVLPDLRWCPSSEIEEGAVCLKINDRPQWMALAIRTRELWVPALVERLKELKVQARPALEPSYRIHGSIICSSDKRAVEEAGLLTFGPATILRTWLFSAILSTAYRLLGIEQVKFLLGQLDTSFPDLVRAALARFTLEDLTRVLRSLVREQVSIRDLRTILDQLLLFDTIAVEPDGCIVFDDRLPLREEITQAHDAQCEFIRVGLKDYLGRKYSLDGNTMKVLLLSTNLEARVAALSGNARNGAGLDTRTENELESIRGAIWAEFGPAGRQADSVVLTGRPTRRGLRDILAPEFPDLGVLAYDEVPADVIVVPCNSTALDTVERIRQTRLNVNWLAFAAFLRTQPDPDLEVQTASYRYALESLPVEHRVEARPP